MPKINIKTIYIYYLLTFFVVPLGFLVRVFLTKTIDIEMVGIIYSIIGFFSIISIFIRLGISSSLKYFFPKLMIQNNNKKIAYLFQISLLIQILLLIISSSIILSLSSYLAKYYFHNEIQTYISIFIIYFIFLNLNGFMKDIFVSFKESYLFKLIRFAELLSLVSFISVSYFIIDKDKLFYYSLSWGLASGLTLIIFSIILYHKYQFLFKKTQKDKRLFQKHLKYSIYLFSTLLGMNILNLTDIQVITFLSNMEYVALYSNSFALVNTLASVFATVNIILIPLFSELQERKKYNQLINILNIFYNLIFYLILPICLLLFLFPEIILKIVYGINYTEGSSILAILSLFMIFKIIFSFNLAFLHGIGSAKNLFKIILSIALLNLILNIILINILGIMGVVFSTVLSWILITVFTLKLIIKKIGFKYNYKKGALIIFSNMLFLIFLFSIKKIKYFENIYINYIIIIMLGYCFYLIIGYLIGIYKIKEFYLFIPTKKLKIKIEYIHQKYFYFLK